MTRISVIVATLGRVDLLAANLQSAIEHRPRPLELIVVDGDNRHSALPAVEQVRGKATIPVRYVASPRGLTTQRNRGLDEAHGDVVLFLDDDARMQTGVLRSLAQAYADPRVVGATGRVLEPASNRVGGKSSRLRWLLFGRSREGQFTTFGYPRRLVREHIARDVEFMPGCFMSARTDLARRERFDEELSGYALAEDEDFSFRISRHGRVVYLPDAVVVHDNRGFRTRDRRMFGRQVILNRYYLFEKNFRATPLRKAQFAFFVIILLGHRLVNRDVDGARGLLEGSVEVLRSGGVR